MSDGRLARLLVEWQARHGRHDLPWQSPRDPYRVWLSEVMLQQTQVATVKAYFQRFVQRFPDVQTLAAAADDDVMAQWSGLGYYSRARNLLRCAREVVQRHGGHFPRSAGELERLPGIGPSTAAAIAAFCFGERVSILDGNVRRVLARCLAFDGDLARPAEVKRLWQQAHALVPTEDRQADMPAYTQGLMDLGATVCLPRGPDCPRCPWSGDCRARAQGDPQRYPVKTRRLTRSAQSWWLLWLRRADGAVWLQRRPARGIWAGLHAPPVFDSEAAVSAALSATLSPHLQGGPVLLHVLTHRDLYLHPLTLHWPPYGAAGEGFQARPLPVPEALQPGRWCGPHEWDLIGLPAPVRRLLEQAHAGTAP